MGDNTAAALNRGKEGRGKEGGNIEENGIEPRSLFGPIPGAIVRFRTSGLTDPQNESLRERFATTASALRASAGGP